MRVFITRLLVRIAPFNFLIAAIQVLGWDIAIPKGNDDEYIIGLITGRTEYVEKILDALEKGKYNNGNN